MEIQDHIKGGVGSGNFSHAGRPGEVGGSAGNNHLTESQAFKEWFGDSKVVDENGKPLVVYHGTLNDFNEFADYDIGKPLTWDVIKNDKGEDAVWMATNRRRGIIFKKDGAYILDAKPAAKFESLEDAQAEAEKLINPPVRITRYDGFYFSQDPVYTDIFAKDYGPGEERYVNHGLPSVMPVYLKIEKPAVIGNEDVWKDMSPFFMQGFDREGWDVDKDTAYKLFKMKHWAFGTLSGTSEAFQSKGYDGIIFQENELGNKLTTTYAVFKPTQIKSATGNRGTFDPSHPDITKSLKATPQFSGYVFNPYMRAYVPLVGNPVDTSGVRSIISEIRSGAANRMAALAEGVVDGSITNLAQFAIDFKKEIKTLYLSTHTLARGGVANMTQSDWGKLGAAVREQFRYADKFVRDIENERTKMAIQQRIGLYTDSAWGARGEFENVVRDRELKLGSLERRVLGEADHCDECFIAGTQILTDKGWFPIETIKIGDTVATGWGFRKVTNTIVKPAETLVRLSLKDREVICTPNHPILTSNGWVAAGDLRPDDEIICSKDMPKIVKGQIGFPYVNNRISQTNKVDISNPTFLYSNKLSSTERFKPGMPVPPISVNFNNSFAYQKVTHIPPTDVDLSFRIQFEHFKILRSFSLWFSWVQGRGYFSSLHKISSAFVYSLHSSLSTGLSILGRFFNPFKSFGHRCVNNLSSIYQPHFQENSSTSDLLVGSVHLKGTRGASFHWIEFLDNIIFFLSPPYAFPISTFRAFARCSQKLSTAIFALPLNLQSAIAAFFRTPALFRSAFAYRFCSRAISAQPRFTISRLSTEGAFRIFGIRAISAFLSRFPFVSSANTGLSTRQTDAVSIVTPNLVRETFCTNEPSHILTYNLEVEEHHTYIANGIIAHNCVELAERNWQPPGLMPDIGDTECGLGCACRYEFENTELDALNQAFGADIRPKRPASSHTQIGMEGNPQTEQDQFTLFPDMEKSLKGGPGSGRYPKGSGEDNRTARALISHKPVTREKHIISDKVEELLASELEGIRTNNNSPFDVLIPGHAIEVKTIIDAANDKITMHPDSLARKLAYAKNHRVKPHTIVIDKRGGQENFYYRNSLGSFRLNSMERVSLDRLKGLFA